VKDEHAFTHRDALCHRDLLSLYWISFLILRGRWYARCCCYERRGVVVSTQNTRSRWDNCRYIRHAGVQGAALNADDIIPARYSVGNAGRICIFLQLEDGPTAVHSTLAGTRVNGRFFSRHDTPGHEPSPIIAFNVYVERRGECRSSRERNKTGRRGHKKSAVTDFLSRLIGLRAGGSDKAARSIYRSTTPYWNV